MTEGSLSPGAGVLRRVPLGHHTLVQGEQGGVTLRAETLIMSPSPIALRTAWPPQRCCSTVESSLAPCSSPQRAGASRVRAPATPHRTPHTCPVSSKRFWSALSMT